MTELVHVCHMNAKLLGIPRVYFCGNFVNHEITRRDITSLFAVRNLFEMNQVRCFFFRFSKSVKMLAGNKCQRCIEFRVMFRVELHFWQDFFALSMEFHCEPYVNTMFLYEANLASCINSTISRRFNRKIKKYRF